MTIPQIPEPDVAIHSIDIDPDGADLSAVNSKVRVDTECKCHRKSVNQIPSRQCMYQESQCGYLQ